MQLWHSSAVRSCSLRQIHFNGGEAQASSVDFYKQASTAFHGQNDHHHYWHSGDEKFPKFIWYDFIDQRRSAAKVTFMSRYPERSGNLEKALNQMPSKFQLVGSNDGLCAAESTWTVICEDLSGKVIESVNELRGCSIKKDRCTKTTQRKYRCLGLKILDNSGNGPYTSLRKIKMWTYDWVGCWIQTAILKMQQLLDFSRSFKSK